MKLKLLAIVVLLVVAGGAVAYSLGVFVPSSATATTYLTSTAAVTDITNDIAATGSVAPTESWNLAFGQAATSVAATASSSSSSSSSNSSNTSNSSNSSGSGSTSVSWPVSTVTVAVGASVKKGQVLATASTSDLAVAIEDANRSAQSAAYQLSIAQSNRTNATSSQVANADIQLLQAESSAASANQTLANLKAEQAYATLTAPADGVVTAVDVTAGQTAPSGTAITIASNTLEVTTSVVETDIPLITVGETASVTLTAVNATVTGTVTSIAPSGSSSGSNGSVAFDVEVVLGSTPAGVRSGMSASVTITTASASNALAIPSRALSGTAGNYTVRILNADGSVTVQSVQVGLVTSSLAQITSGLNAGDKVITGTSSAQQGTTTTTTRGLGGLGGGGFVGGGGTFRGTNP